VAIHSDLIGRVRMAAFCTAKIGVEWQNWVEEGQPIKIIYVAACDP
jgi:hypothetical protein